MKPSTKKLLTRLTHDYADYTVFMLESELNRRTLVKDYTLNGVKQSRAVVKLIFEKLIKDRKEKE